MTIHRVLQVFLVCSIYIYICKFDFWTSSISGFLYNKKEARQDTKKRMYKLAVLPAGQNLIWRGWVGH